MQSRAEGFVLGNVEVEVDPFLASHWGLLLGAGSQVALHRRCDLVLKASAIRCKTRSLD